MCLIITDTVYCGLITVKLRAYIFKLINFEQNTSLNAHFVIVLEMSLISRHSFHGYHL